MPFFAIPNTLFAFAKESLDLIASSESLGWSGS